MDSRFRSIPGIVVLLFLLAGGISTALSAEQSLSPADKEFLAKAAIGGMMEVALADLATTRAGNPQVKDFAQALAQDHTAANRQLLEITKEVGAQVPQDMGDENQKMITDML